MGLEVNAMLEAILRTIAMSAGEKSIRILLADPHPVFRSGLRLFLQEQPDFVVVGEASTHQEAALFLRRLLPDVLLISLDIASPSGIRALCEESRKVRVVLLAPAIDPAQASEAFRLGVRGILLLDVNPEVLFNCVQAVMEGHQWIGQRRISDFSSPFPGPQASSRRKNSYKNFGLTRREMEILVKVADSTRTLDIAQQLKISEKTVKRHIANIYDKTGVYNRLELMLFAILHGLLDHS